jgi:ubiquinone/menaquinone biosynthesis C-methylase UbiE
LNLRLAREYYRKRAVNYDEQKARTWKSDKGFADEIVDYIVKSAERYGMLGLEAGIGTGRVASALLERSHASLVGVDFSSEMILVARKKFSSLRMRRRLTLVEADLHKLPFRDRTFDFALCISVLHYIVPAIVVKEFYRVLLPKGHLILGDLIIHPDDDQGFMQKLEESLSPAHHLYYRPNEWQELLESCGFQVEDCRIIPYDKSYRALVEDKCQYFGSDSHSFHLLLEEASPHVREVYDLRKNAMKLYFGILASTARR